MLSLLLTAAMAAAPAAPAWHDGLDWHGVHVAISRDEKHEYTLAWPYGQRVIAAQPLAHAKPPARCSMACSRWRRTTWRRTR